MSTLIRIFTLALVLVAFEGCTKKKKRSGTSRAQDATTETIDGQAGSDSEDQGIQPDGDAHADATGTESPEGSTEGTGDAGTEQEGTEGVSTTEDMALPAEQANGVNLIWKRYRAFENGLIDALELSKEQLCKELGEFSCVDEVSLSHLGGNDVNKGQLSYVSRPTAITPIAIDRIVLAACVARAELDQAAGSAAAVLFKQFALDGAMVAEDAAVELTNSLYQRFLARDAEEEELVRARNFASQGLSGRVVAIGLCYAVGTLSEGQFF